MTILPDRSKRLQDLIELSGKMKNGPFVAGAASQLITDLISKQLYDLAKNPKPPRAISAGGLVETFYGHPLEDILDGIPAHRKIEAITEMRKMAGGIGAFGGGGGGGGGGIVFPTAPPQQQVSHPFNHIDALCMRMRWANLFSTPFENVFIHVAPAKKIFIFIITKELKTVTLDIDDDALFPSDHLIAELRLLGG